MNRLCIFMAFLLSLMASFIESGCTSDNILDGHVLVNELYTDFENKDWVNNHYRSDDDNYWHDPPPPIKRGVESLRIIDTPAGGKVSSLRALEVSRVSDSKQQEILSPTFKKKLGKVLKRTDKPVFIVRVYLSNVNQWAGFGFRHHAYAKGIAKVIPDAKDDKYDPSIWVKRVPKVSFYFRAANGQPGDKADGPMVKPGWWTWAIAFDDKGVGHYYISKGTNVPTKNDKVCSTSGFPPPNNPYMDEIEYSYFSISAIIGGNESSKFVIDNYEVWVAKTEIP